MNALAAALALLAVAVCGFNVCSTIRTPWWARLVSLLMLLVCWVAFVANMERLFP